MAKPVREGFPFFRRRTQKQAPSEKPSPEAKQEPVEATPKLPQLRSHETAALLELRNNYGKYGFAALPAEDLLETVLRTIEERIEKQASDTSNVPHPWRPGMSTLTKEERDREYSRIYREQLYKQAGIKPGHMKTDALYPDFKTPHKYMAKKNRKGYHTPLAGRKFESWTRATMKRLRKEGLVEVRKVPIGFFWDRSKAADKRGQEGKKFVEEVLFQKDADTAKFLLETAREMNMPEAGLLLAFQSYYKRLDYMAPYGPINREVKEHPKFEEAKIPVIFLTEKGHQLAKELTSKERAKS